MKRLMIFPLLFLMTGCVTYYYPENAVEDGVYYAQDDSAYVDESYGYDYAAHYPWTSMDSFYLGFGGYAGGYPRTGLSFGVSYGYTPWYEPYNSFYASGYYSSRYFSPWYYAPWYAPYYSHYYRPYYSSWWPYYRHCRKHHSCGHRERYAGHHGGRYDRNRNDRDRRGHNRHDRDTDDRDRHDRYSGSGRGGSLDRGRDNNHPGDTARRGRMAHGDKARDRDAAPLRRYVSTTPPGHEGDRGMVIRNRASAKSGKSRTEPYTSRPARSARARTPSVNAARPAYRVRQAGGEVYYRSDVKQGRSHTTPVAGTTHRRSYDAVVTPGRAPDANYRSGQAAGEIQYRGGAKRGRSYTTPARAYSTAPSDQRATRPVGQVSRQGMPVRSQAARPERQTPRQGSAPTPSRGKAERPVRGQHEHTSGSRGPSARAPGRSDSDQNSGRRGRRQ